MPIYEYECKACHERIELIQKFSDPVQTKCPSCGKEALHKLISSTAFHLKGSGWYVTDFRGKNKKPDDSFKAEENKAAEKPEKKAEATTATEKKKETTTGKKDTK